MTLDAPVSFDDANKWLAGRVGVLTEMTSKELALSKDFSNSVKASSFFSAQVASARVLSRLREVSDEYSSGKIGLADARTQLKLFLHGEGYQPDDVSGETGSGVSVENLASTARLNLILEQNANMGRAVGDREVSMDPDVMERFPYYRYVASTAANPREDHAKFAGLVLPKDDPFWRSHTPPWDYNCQCGLEDVSEEEAQAEGVAQARPEGGQGDWLLQAPNGRQLDARPPESGFSFDIDSAFDALDMSRVEGVPMRQAVFNSVRDFAKENPDIRFKCVPEAKPLESMALDGAASLSSIEGFLREHLPASSAKAELALGALSPELKDALGLAEEAKVRLTSGTLKHVSRNHAADLGDGKFLSALSETFYSPGSLTSMEFKGGTAYLAFYNEETGAFAAARRVGDGWSDWELMQAMYPRGTDYQPEHRTMRKKKTPTQAGTMSKPPPAS